MARSMGRAPSTISGRSPATRAPGSTGPSTRFSTLLRRRRGCGGPGRRRAG
ncbi:hypothetical protein [Kitasatospora sp. McL0602]|uniref:hypothetical protein n=1 Tax=Kitasatospora sp. McL0602 TaxID=3439530 RepID=UPI003F89C44B